MLVLSWSLTVGVLTLIFIIVIFMMRKDEQKDKRKLYNFDLAPRELVDDDSFILKEN